MLLELFKTLNLKQQIISGGNKKLFHRAKEILTEAAAGLAHLHEKGWVHRDIKPDNFLVNDENIVKLIDFNLAQKPAGGLGKLFGAKTKVQGTHSYMAPEQIRGQPLDARADVYSFGCMIYEFFAGKTPFTANSPTELLQRHLTSKPPDLTVVDKNITPEFSKYVQSMMAKDAAARPGHDERRHDGNQNPKNLLQQTATAGAEERNQNRHTNKLAIELTTTARRSRRSH